MGNVIWLFCCAAGWRKSRKRIKHRSGALPWLSSMAINASVDLLISPRSLPISLMKSRPRCHEKGFHKPAKNRIVACAYAAASQ